MKKPFLLLLTTACLLAARLTHAQGQGYALDPTFGTGGKVLTSLSTPAASTDVLLDVEVLAGNKLLVLAKGSSGLVKLRYNADGTLDTTFGTAGRLALASPPAGFTPATATATTHDLLPDGRVLLVGSQTTVANNALLLYAADGSLAPGFGTNGLLSLLPGMSASSWVLLANGKVLVASSAAVTTSTGGFSGGNMQISQLLSNGAIEFTAVLAHQLIAPATYAGHQAIVVNTSLVLQPDGKVLAVGTGTEPGSSNQFLALARIQATGSPDASFGTGGTTVLYYKAATNPAVPATLAGGPQGIVLLPSGKFLLNITSSQFSVLGFTAAGQLDTAYGNQGLGYILSSQVPNIGAAFLQPDGSLLVGGAAANMLAARLTSQGVLDPTLTPTGSATPYLTASFGGQATAADIDNLTKIVTLPTGELVLAGSSFRGSTSSTHPAGSLPALLRFRPASALATSASRALAGVRLYPNPSAGTAVQLAGLPAGQVVTATILNAVGQVVGRQAITAPASGAAATLALPALAPGLYRLRLASEQGAGSYPLAVQ